MADRKKAIEGLELCLKGLCDICPYKDSDAPGGCKDELMYDAMLLLQALDVTPEELERLKMCRAECKIDCLLEHYNKVKDELDAMKKAQEPKLVACEVKRVLQDDSYDVATYADEVFYNCPKCGKRFSRYRPAKDINYCPNCGQAVKWE